MRIRRGPRNTNEVLATLENANSHALREISAFRGRASAQEAFEEFTRRKRDVPFVGFVPCRAAGIDFVLFHANDDVVAWEYLWFGQDAYERDLVQTWVDWCRAARGRIYDIGGYSGVMSVLAARASERSVVHLFEPIDRTVERAKINMRANGVSDRVRLHNVAASDASGPVDVNLYRQEDFLGTGNSIYDKGLAVQEVKTVRQVRIDDELPQHNPSVVKIDVEGHEKAVLEGMLKTLERARPRMIVEIWEHSRADVLGLLKSRGYRCTPFGDPEARVVNYVCVAD